MTISKHAVRMSINGIGINHNDFYDIDKSLKKAYTDETEQWMVLSHVDSAASKALYEEARKKVEGGDYEMSAN